MMHFLNEFHAGDDLGAANQIQLQVSDKPNKFVKASYINKSVTNQFCTFIFQCSILFGETETCKHIHMSAVITVLHMSRMTNTAVMLDLNTILTCIDVCASIEVGVLIYTFCFSPEWKTFSSCKPEWQNHYCQVRWVFLHLVELTFGNGKHKLMLFLEFAKLKAATSPCGRSKSRLALHRP